MSVSIMRMLVDKGTRCTGAHKDYEVHQNTYTGTITVIHVYKVDLLYLYIASKLWMYLYYQFEW